MKKANAQQKNTIRRGPYAKSPVTNRAIKKTLKKIPMKKKIIPRILMPYILL
jgi:hypothetical protein